MKTKRTSGYSEDLAKLYVPENSEVILLSTFLDPRPKWKDGKPTEEISGYRILCGMADDFFYVKFDKKVKLPPFKSTVKLVGLQACEVSNEVYFKAENVEEVK